MSDSNKFIQLALAVIETEGQAIAALSARINIDFQRACELLLQTSGRVVVLGMGKSGHIASKIAATLASTGTPAFFVHPGEASHGDLGMITPQDTVLALSNSGETPELVNLLPMIKRLGVHLITLSKPSATLAQAADINLDVSVAREACPMGLAPTASTTVALVMGDALAVALLNARGFTPEDFARSHPGGKLGRQLLLHISDIMVSGDHNIPMVSPSATISQALLEITQKKLGMTCVADKKLLGIFTDGDLRRALDKNLNIHTTPITQAMTRDPITVAPDCLAIDALNLMEAKKITTLVVMTQGKITGVIHLHDLLQAGIT